MKNVLVILAITLAGISAPQNSFAEIVSPGYEISLQDKVEYTAIEKEELPVKVTESMKKLFMGYEISESYKGNDNSYKLVLLKGEEAVAAYFDVEGEFLKKETEEK